MEGGTVVREPPWVWTLVWAGFPLLGGTIGLLVVPVASWAADGRWIPFRGLFRLVDRHSGTAMTVGLVAAGAAAGLLLALIGHGEKLTVTVDRHGIDLRRDEKSRRVDRAGTAGVHRDGKELVLLDARGFERAREKSGLDWEELAAAFRAQGWPWRDADPYAGDFRLWVDELADLPPGANPLLRARSKVLGKEEAVELRGELARVGVVVRDDGKRQYVRTVR